MLKYNKHKDSASTASVAKAKELGDITIHPFFASKISKEEQTLMNLQSEIKSFRPKLNAIE